MRTTLRSVDTPLGPAEVTVHRPPRARGTLLLTHGANGAMTTPDLVALTTAVPECGWAIGLVRQAWAVAGRRTPPRPDAQDEAWLPVVAALTTGRGALPRPLVVGGRSNGARVAARTAPETGADAVLALAFPLHPPGQPDRLRADELRVPYEHGIRALVVQGATDAFGSPDEVRAHCPDPATVVGVKGGHGFSRPPADVVRVVVDLLGDLAGR